MPRVNRDTEEQEYTELFKAMCTRSSKGNLTRKLLDGPRVTIFSKAGMYRISIKERDSREPYYPDGEYDSEDEAIEALITLLDADGIEWRSPKWEEMLNRASLATERSLPHDR